MPLSLVLHATFTTWHRQLQRLNDWNQLVDLELVLINRARGAFMARWFGTGLPLYMGDLRIAISNLDELRTRYRELQRAAAAGDPDRNLIEPLAGITGTLAGSLLSPTSSMVLLSVIDEQMPRWYTTLAAALNALTFGALGTLATLVGVPLAGAGVPYWALTRPDQAVAVYDTLGVLARLLIAARRFIEQLVGPRSEVRNPLLGKLLDLLGGLATLLPFVFAFGAFVITWLGPKLKPLAEQIDLMIDLIRSVFELIGEVVSDLLDRLGALFSGPHSLAGVLHGVIATLRGGWAATQKQLNELMAAGGKAFDKVSATLPPGTMGPPPGELRLWHQLKEAFDNARLKAFVRSMTSESWLVRRGKEIGTRLVRIAAVFGHLDLHPVVKPKPGWFGRQTGKITGWAKERQIGKLKEALPGWPADLNFPTTPTIGDFPSVAEILGQARLRAPPDPVDSSYIADAFRKPIPEVGFVFSLDAEAEKALAKLRRSPPDVFAGERRALRADPQLGGRTLEQFLRESQQIEARLRTLLFSAIDNLLPAAAAAEVPKLQGLLWDLDDALYGKKAEFPVRDLPGGDELNVKVSRVRVQAPGHRRNEVRAWGRDLKSALEGQRYRTAAAVPA